MPSHKWKGYGPDTIIDEILCNMTFEDHVWSWPLTYRPGSWARQIIAMRYTCSQVIPKAINKKESYGPDMAPNELSFIVMCCLDIRSRSKADNRLDGITTKFSRTKERTVLFGVLTFDTYIAQTIILLIIGQSGNNVLEIIKMTQNIYFSNRSEYSPAVLGVDSC